ncbi:MerR family transcriptional regulator [Glycomyces tarimensis]
MLTWTTADVSKMAGVSARTLRHYDAIGLLEPAETGHGGLRRYGHAELLRLQQILLLRRLGLALATIGEILDGGLDTIEALRRHADQLAEERRRLDRLAASVDATITQLEEGTTMEPETWFEGFDATRQAAYEAEARRRWGDAVVDAGDRAIRQMSPAERAAIPETFAALHRRLAEQLAAGRGADCDAAQDIVADHYRLIERLWGTAPTGEAYKGLAALYTDDAAFTATYDEVATGLARYLREAMDHYADTVL